MMRLFSTRALTGVMPLLLLMSAGVPQAQAQRPGSSEPTAGGCEEQLRCSVGETRTYDYSAVFVSDADVETAEKSGYAAATMAGSAQVAVTATSALQDQCTYEVQLKDVAVVEYVKGEPQETPRSEEIAEVVGDAFYFTQGKDGQIKEVAVGREDLPEAATFKRGVVNSLNVTLKDGDRYEVTESDISGTHLAQYTATRDGDQKILNRTIAKGESLLKQGDDMEITFQSTQTSRVTIDEQACVISQVDIDETVIIDQPEAGDPAVSGTFHHETIRVRAAATLTLMSNSINKARRAAGPGIDSPDLVRLPVNAAVSTSSESLGKVIHELLQQMRDGADNSQLVRELSRSVRADPQGVDHLRTYIDGQLPTGRMARTLGALLISVGTADAQAVLVEGLLGSYQDDETLERLIGLSTLIDHPSPALVAKARDLAARSTTGSSTSATLALGAYANKLRATNPVLANELTRDLSYELRTADKDATILYLRALGNAGAPETLAEVVSYLDSDDRLTRQSAVIALRKIESAEVDRALLAQLSNEGSESVQQSIRRVIAERVTKGLSEDNAQTKAVIIDWNWSQTFGGNVASVTPSASALVEDEPYLIDLQAAANGQVFNNDFDIFDMQVLTERVNATDRRFRFFISLAGNEIANIDETETCSVAGETTLWNEDIDLLNLSSPPIPIIGPLTLSFTLDLGIEFYVNFFREGDWCTSNSDLQMGFTPGMVVTADGYATLSLLVVRGGVGIAGTLVGLEFPIYADARMDMQNAPEVCFKIDAQLLVADMELYAWGQYRLFWGWRPNPRPRWTLWSFNLSPDAWNLVSECEANPDLNCLPDVLWWDGSTIDAWYDGANCFVTSPPAGSSPFVYANNYYIQEDSNCPPGTTWDGTGCLEANINTWIGINVNLGTQGNLATLAMFRIIPFGPVPPCPSGWTTVSSSFGSRTCSQQPPAGFTAQDYFMVNPTSSLYRIYINGSASCTAGNYDGANCFLGSAPGGTTAFLWSGNFYYAEP